MPRSSLPVLLTCRSAVPLCLCWIAHPHVTVHSSGTTRSPSPRAPDLIGLSLAEAQCTSSHFVKFRADRSNHCLDMAIFWFFKISAVRHLGFILREFGFYIDLYSQWVVAHKKDFARCAWKCLFMPPFCFWGPLDPMCGEWYQQKTPKGTYVLAWKLEKHRMSYRLSKSVHWCGLCAWRRDQKRKTKKSYSGKL